MRSLLEHDVANMPRLWDVLLSIAAPNFKTSECRSECRFFGRRPGRDRGSGLPFDGIVRKQRMRVVQVRVSPMPFRPVFGHCFGAYATPGGRLVLLLCYAPYGLRFPPSADPP